MKSSTNYFLISSKSYPRESSAIDFSAQSSASPERNQKMSVPISKAPKLGEGREQWLQTMKFECVKCGALFDNREKLLHHYDSTRHDKYSAWK